MIKGLTGRNIVLLDGTEDEIRAAAKFLLDGDVELTPKGGADSDTSRVEGEST